MGVMVRIITPEQIVWSAIAQSIILPTPTGKLGILRGHIPLTTFIEAGVIQLKVEQRWIAVACLQGFAQVQDDEITVLVNRAERGHEIDPQNAQTAVEAATAIVEHATTQAEKRRATQTLKRATVWLEAAQFKRYGIG